MAMEISNRLGLANVKSDYIHTAGRKLEDIHERLLELEAKGEVKVIHVKDENKPIEAETLLGWKKKIPTNKLWHHKSCGQCGNIPGYPVSLLWFMNQMGLEYVDERTPFVMVLSAIFAGWLITLMTWLLIASSGTLARIFIIWVVGFMIYLNSFSHIVVASSEILIAINTGSHISYLPWLYRYVPLTIIGNMIGGLFFVTILQYLQILHAASPAPDEHFSSSSYELDMMGGGGRTKTAEMENVENIEDTI